MSQLPPYSPFPRPRFDQQALDDALSSGADSVWRKDPNAQPTAPQTNPNPANPADWGANQGVRMTSGAQGGTGGAIYRPGGVQGSQAPSGPQAPRIPAATDVTTVGQGAGGLRPGYAGHGNAQNGMKSFMHGFDANNYNDPKMNSVKYRFGRMASDANANTPQAMAKLVASPEFQAAFKGATFDGKDKVNFNGALSDGATGTPVGLIDVLEAADAQNNTANGVWWGWDQGGAETFGGPGQAHGAPPQPNRTMDDVMGPGPLENNLAQQQAPPPQSQMEELMALLEAQQQQYSSSLRGI